MPPLSSSEVIEAVRAHYLALKSLDASSVTDTDVGNPHAADSHSESVVRCEFGPDALAIASRFYVESLIETSSFIVDPETDGKTKVPTDVRKVWSFDGSVSRIFEQSTVRYPDGHSHRSTSTYGKITRRPEYDGPPWSFGPFPIGIWPLDRLLDGAAVSGAVMSGGADLYVIDAFWGRGDDPVKKHNIRFHADPAHGFALCRSEFGKPAYETAVVDFASVSGIWMPRASTAVRHSKDHPATWRSRTEYSRVNCDFADNDFAFDWPHGTLVRDEVTGQSYTA
jgi:hypothetical protein